MKHLKYVSEIMILGEFEEALRNWKTNEGAQVNRRIEGPERLRLPTKV